MFNLFGRVGECQIQSCDMKYSWTSIKRPPAQGADLGTMLSTFLNACSGKGRWEGGGGGEVNSDRILTSSILRGWSLVTKNLTDFRKTVETGMDPLLLALCYGVFADQFISRHILGHFFPPE